MTAKKREEESSPDGEGSGKPVPKTVLIKTQCLIALALGVIHGYPSVECVSEFAKFMNAETVGRVDSSEEKLSV